MFDLFALHKCTLTCAPIGGFLHIVDRETVHRAHWISQLTSSKLRPSTSPHCNHNLFLVLSHSFVPEWQSVLPTFLFLVGNSTSWTPDRTWTSAMSKQCHHTFCRIWQHSESHCFQGHANAEKLAWAICWLCSIVNDHKRHFWICKINYHQISLEHHVWFVCPSRKHMHLCPTGSSAHNVDGETVHRTQGI